MRNGILPAAARRALVTVLFTILVTVVFVAPISLAYLLTREQVALNEAVFLKKAVLAAAGIPIPRKNEEIVSLFAARVEETGTGLQSPVYYRVRVQGSGAVTEAGPAPNGEPAGYVFIRTGPGLWGEIQAAIGFDKDLAYLTGVDFLKQAETPGLGARIDESWFKAQFRGKKGPFSTVAEGETAGENEFDAITGATITSNAVKSLLNATIEQVKNLVN